MPFIPHTLKDKDDMLSALAETCTDALFDEIPREYLCEPFHLIPDGINEMSLLTHASQLARQLKNGVCFLGAGCYEHHIPAAVWDITSRGEFLTAYTPYQAEASQGTLQLLYEFQTMIAELTGMQVANASLYDGASALAEAVLMAARIHPKAKINRDKPGPVLIAGVLHPFYRDTLETILQNQHIEIISLPVNPVTGTTLLSALDAYKEKDLTAVVIVQPNFFGGLEPVDELTRFAAQQETSSIALVNPISLGLLKPPGLWGDHGVDIACGEGQPFGCPMASGGPFFGFFSTKLQHVRQMPGRLIGRTLDKEGKQGFSLTLQAREQHIRRAKATSNICTNQGLLVTAATIHMSLLGSSGLHAVAKACHRNTHALVNALTAIEGVSKPYSGPFFHEALITLNQPVKPILQQLSASGILGGWDVSAHFPHLKNSLLVCATEMRTENDITLYAETLSHLLRGN